MKQVIQAIAAVNHPVTVLVHRQTNNAVQELNLAWTGQAAPTVYY
jgi:hypothetical protein